MFIAAQNGHRTLLSLLLTAGGEPDTKRIDGATPLWIAAQIGHDHICRVLLQHGANVNVVRCDGATPLFKAAHKGHAAVITELLRYRPYLGLLAVRLTHFLLPPLASCNGVFHSVFTFFLSSFFQNGESPLHAAAMFGYLTVVKQLVAAGSDILLRNSDNRTALEVAQMQQYSSIVGYLQERQRLLQQQ